MFSSAKEKKLAKGTVSGIQKSGYLTKSAKNGSGIWKQRYFVLTTNTLTYFSDHKKTGEWWEIGGRAGSIYGEQAPPKATPTIH